MKRSPVIIIILLLLAVAMGRAQSDARPGLVVLGGTTIDMGYVLPGKAWREVKLVFEGGMKPLRILDVRVMNAIIDSSYKPYLLPGDTLTLRAALETIQTVGRQSGSVIIETDNPAQGLVSFTLVAKARRPLYSRGGGAGGVVGEVIQTTITLVNMSPEPVTVAQTVEQVGCCDCHADIWADLSGTRYIRAGDSIEVPIGMVARRPGSSRCDLEFRAEDPSIPPQRVIITAYATEPERKK